MGTGSILGIFLGLLFVILRESSLRIAVIFGGFLGLIVGAIMSYFSPTFAIVELSGPPLLIIALLLFLIGHFLYMISVHFEEDVVKYMMSEVYLLSKSKDW